MNCPRLPTVPSGIISKIDPSWFRTLNECLTFAMTHPGGDGVTIFQDAGGSLRAAAPSGDGGDGVPVGGWFSVAATEYDEQGRITCNSHKNL